MKKAVTILLISLMLFTSGCAVMTAAAPEPTPAPPTVEELLADALKYYNAGNYEEAILLYEAAIEIEPRNFDATVGLGKAYRSTGNNGQAVEALKAAYELNDSPDVAFELGCAYIANGQYADAENFASELWKDGEGGHKAGTLLLLSLAAQGKIEDVIEMLQNENFNPFLSPGKGSDFLYMGGYDENGECSGYGVSIYWGGYIYAGEYRDGVRSGQGTWYYQEGNYFIGKWANDKPNGYGEYHVIDTNEDREFRTLPCGNGMYHLGFDGGEVLPATHSGNYTDGYENGEMTVSYEDHVASYVSKMGIRQLTGKEHIYEGFSRTWYYYAICKKHKGRCEGKWDIGDRDLHWGVTPWGMH